MFLIFFILKNNKANFSKRKSDLEKQVILLMIPIEEKWNYLKLSVLFIGITSK